MPRHITIPAVVLLATQLWAGPVLAQTIAAPTGDVVLTISGEIDQTNVGETLQFDMEAIAELADATIVTSTNWTVGVHTFEGVSLHTLTELLGVTDGTLKATAINNYAVSIPVSDAQPDGPIIAYLKDGSEMSVRERGPLWVIYPYDTHPDYQTAVIQTRSIWQLDRIDVLK